LTTHRTHQRWMEKALTQAKIAGEKGEVPVGAVVVMKQAVIGQGHNQCESLNDPTAHAEIIAISAAANTLNDWRLSECTLYVTKEPCAMCAGAIINARLSTVVFGCYDEKYGCCGSQYLLCGDRRLGSKTAVVGGVLDVECKNILQAFFHHQRDHTSKTII